MSEVMRIPIRIWSLGHKIARLHILVRHHRVRFFFHVWQSFHWNLACRQYDCFQKTKELVSFPSQLTCGRVTHRTLGKGMRESREGCCQKFGSVCIVSSTMFFQKICTAAPSCTTARIYHMQRRGVSPAVE